MKDCLRPEKGKVSNEIAVLALAHVGDAVYELMARTWLISQGAVTARRLHSSAVSIVSSKAQAVSAERLLTELSEDELSIYKRGRNAYANSAPNGASYGEYHASTGIEALFGHLYLSGESERLNELFGMIVD